jgi:LAO/AO transport system kinase
MLLNLLPEIQLGNFKALARCISGIENQDSGSALLLKKLPPSKTPVIGFTGPPGAGKSTVVNALIGTFVKQHKKVAVLCIDPSSPFHHGAFLGDRIRMNQWTGNPNVFIRSLSSRGSLGGLNPRIYEISDLLKAAPFDYILIETVGIGQSEMEIAGIADFTVVILTPGSGDDIQALKSGILEIADLFVVNKSDYPNAKQFIANLQSALSLGSKDIDILETIATEGVGIDELARVIVNKLIITSGRGQHHLAEKVIRLMLAEKMKEINKTDLLDKIKQESGMDNFNVYVFVENYLSGTIK